MFAIADHGSRTLHAGAEMRPRRWYTDEHAPPARAARMTSQLWRYRALAQRRRTTPLQCWSGVCMLGYVPVTIAIGNLLRTPILLQ